MTEAPDEAEFETVNHDGADGTETTELGASVSELLGDG